MRVSSVSLVLIHGKKQTLTNLHQLEHKTHGSHCTVCDQNFSLMRDPSADPCPGVKVYDYQLIPWQKMTTATQLKQQHHLKLASGQKPVGCYFRSRDSRYIYLYSVSNAIPEAPLTEAQAEAVVKMRDGLKAAYTCEKCGYYDHAHGQRGRLDSVSAVVDKTGPEPVEHRYCWDCADILQWHRDRREIERDMQQRLNGERSFVVMDTETTGLPGSTGFQVVEVSVVDRIGAVIFHSLVKPDIPVPEQASRVHGLDDAALADAPGFAQIWPSLLSVLEGHEILTYNVDFDRSALLASARRASIVVSEELRDRSHWRCLMMDFSDWYGEPGRKPDEPARWQSLASACATLGVQVTDAHRATGDAIAALGVMKALALRADDEELPEYRPSRDYV
jgi:DNA polymerase-3 subunit epsilon